MRKIIYIIFLIQFPSVLLAQISIEGRPYGFIKGLKEKSIKVNNKGINVPKLDLEKLQQNDNNNDQPGQPFQYGYAIDVNIYLNNSGEWFELENGDRIWRLTIHCPNAKSINLTYDKFWMPEGGMFFIYDSAQTSYIGAFSKKNNKGTKEKPGKFATDLIFSDKIVLEYFEPFNCRDEGILSISKIIYGFRDLISFGDASSGGKCSININCSPEGDDWQVEKNSVAKILFNGYGCSGSLINNINEDGTPYFLTANHCIETVSLDAITDPDASDWIFHWNYESIGCENGSNFTPPSTNGAIVVANNLRADFALLRLIESPLDISPQIQTYFNGWDRQDPIGGGACIHHPSLDIKKISKYNSIISDPDGYSQWKAKMIQTSNGYSLLYGGSSGSPLYNSQHRVVGQTWSVVYTNCTDQYAYFGKFSYSWDLVGSEARRRLRDWLDPYNSLMYLPGLKYIANQSLISTATILGDDVKLKNVIIQNNASITIDIGYNFIATGTFDAQIGTTLNIQ